MLGSPEAEILLSEQFDLATEISDIIQSDDADFETPENGSISTVIGRRLERTTAIHGITGPEVRRLCGGVHCMKRKRRQLWFLTAGDGLKKMPQGEARKLIADIETDISTLQKKHGLPRDRVTVYHTSGALHAHMILIGSPTMIEDLKKRAIAKYIHVRWAYDVRGLTHGYLVMERTPQANHGSAKSTLGTRKRGSHKLPGGGDRVRLSKPLKQEAIAHGYVEDWQQSNAKRKPLTDRKTYRLRALTRKAVKPSGSLVLFGELLKPVAHLRDYIGGKIPEVVALQINHHRKRLGLSQEELARLAGLSRPTLANALAGRFALREWAANRLREILLSSGRMAA